MTRRGFLVSAGGLAFGLLAHTHTLLAQSKYPDRPIRLIVPFPPGGAFDTVGRPWAEKIKPLLGTVVVENIGGGGSSVDAAQAAHARPDGYTILLGGATTHVPEALLKTRPLYDPLKELEPISGIAVTAFAIAVHPSVPVNDLKELIAYAKANPGKLSYGSAGHGSLNHLTGELFKLKMGITELVHVPYRGAGPAIADILAGQIPMIIPAMTNHVLELHRGGKLKVPCSYAWQPAACRPGSSHRHRAGCSRPSISQLHRRVCAGRHAQRNHRADFRSESKGARRAGLPADADCRDV